MTSRWLHVGAMRKLSGKCRWLHVGAMHNVNNEEKGRGSLLMSYVFLSLSYGYDYIIMKILC